MKHDVDDTASTKTMDSQKGQRSDNGNSLAIPSLDIPLLQQEGDSPLPSSSSGSIQQLAHGRTQPSESTTIRRASTSQSEQAIGSGGRWKVARLLNMASGRLAAKVHSQFEDSGFNAQEKTNFPEIPGESLRNKNLRGIQKAYSSCEQTEPLGRSFKEESTMRQSSPGHDLLPTSLEDLLAQWTTLNTDEIQRVELLAF